MSAVAALSILFECAPGSRFELEHLRETFGDGLERLLASGLLKKAPCARHVTCYDCDEAHDVRVERDEDRLGRFCADGGGWAEVGPEALRRFTFDHDALLAVLADGFGLKGAPETLVEGVCWRIGSPMIADKQVAIVAAREMNDPRRVMEIAGAAHARLKKWRGLILCGARPMVDVGLMPKGLKPVVLDDLIALSEQGEVIIDGDAVEMALGLKRRGRGEHGAPSDHPGLIARIEDRIRAGASRRSAQAEADDLLTDPSWTRQGQPLPQRKTLARFVARERERLATK